MEPTCRLTVYVGTVHGLTEIPAVAQWLYVLLRVHLRSTDDAPVLVLPAPLVVSSDPTLWIFQRSVWPASVMIELYSLAMTPKAISPVAEETVTLIWLSSSPACEAKVPRG